MSNSLCINLFGIPEASRTFPLFFVTSSKLILFILQFRHHLLSSFKISNYSKFFVFIYFILHNLTPFNKRLIIISLTISVYSLWNEHKLWIVRLFIWLFQDIAYKLMSPNYIKTYVLHLYQNKMNILWTRYSDIIKSYLLL